MGGCAGRAFDLALLQPALDRLLCYSLREWWVAGVRLNGASLAVVAGGRAACFALLHTGVLLHTGRRTCMRGM